MNIAGKIELFEHFCNIYGEMINICLSSKNGVFILTKLKNKILQTVSKKSVKKWKKQDFPWRWGKAYINGVGYFFCCQKCTKI